MSINFEEIPSVIEVNANSVLNSRTVLEELNARQYLLTERSIKCKNIKPFYAKMKQTPHPYYYKYFCVCPRYNPQYACKHTGNIIIDRNILTQKEHLLYLATPKPNYAAPRKMPRYFLKKAIISNCTARILRLAKPSIKHVADTLNNFNGIMTRCQQASLRKYLEKSPDVEYTTIERALELLSEEKRLRRAAKRKERLLCQKLSRKIVHKQKQQIKKIIYILFEEMKDILLNDHFIVHESTPLQAVILEALREFADKECNITCDLREYQKILAFNLANWISGLTSNLNIDVTERAPNCTETARTEMENPTSELTTFLPVGDYVLHPSCSEEFRYEEEEEEDAEEEGGGGGDNDNYTSQQEIPSDIEPANKVTNVI